MSQLPFLTTIHVPPQVTSGEAFTLGIQGHWPTPAWGHVDTKLEFGDHRVEVSYLGISRGGLAVQMLQAFSDSVELELETVGTWTVVVRGRAGEQTATTTVRPQSS